MIKNNNSITDIPGIRVGHASNLNALTGCTVILCEAGAVGGVDQRGGAPGTRETDALHPLHLVQQVHAIVLSGGSAFGLESAGSGIFMSIIYPKTRTSARKDRSGFLRGTVSCRGGGRPPRVWRGS